MIATVTFRWNETIATQEGTSTRECHADIHFSDEDGKLTIFSSRPLKVTRIAKDAVEVVTADKGVHVSALDLSKERFNNGGSDV